MEKTIPGEFLSFDNYVNLLLSAAADYDTHYATKHINNPGSSIDIKNPDESKQPNDTFHCESLTRIEDMVIRNPSETGKDVELTDPLLSKTKGSNIVVQISRDKEYQNATHDPTFCDVMCSGEVNSCIKVTNGGEVKYVIDGMTHDHNNITSCVEGKRVIGDHIECIDATRNGEVDTNSVEVKRVIGDPILAVRNGEVDTSCVEDKCVIGERIDAMKYGEVDSAICDRNIESNTSSDYIKNEVTTQEPPSEPPPSPVTIPILVPIKIEFESPLQSPTTTFVAIKLECESTPLPSLCSTPIEQNYCSNEFDDSTRSTLDSYIPVIDDSTRNASETYGHVTDKDIHIAKRQKTMIEWNTGYSSDTSDDASLFTPPKHQHDKARKEYHYKTQSDDSGWSDSDEEFANEFTRTFHRKQDQREKNINGNEMLYCNIHYN